MRKLILILALCLVTSSALASLVQSNTGGSASGSVLSGGNITSSAGGFASNTTTGNLLIFVIYAKQVGGGAGGLSLNSPVISGGYSGTFISGPTSFWTDTGVSGEGIAWIRYLGNAPQMTPSQTATVRANNGAIGTGTVSVEFDVYEFNNITFPLVMDLGVSGTTNNNQTGGTPSVSFSATGNTDLIIAALTAVPGSNISAGSGYVLGINASLATVGQTQYQLSAPSGQTASSFSGTESKWGVGAISFASSGLVSSISRHRGWVF